MRLECAASRLRSCCSRNHETDPATREVAPKTAHAQESRTCSPMRRCLPRRKRPEPHRSRAPSGRREPRAFAQTPTARRLRDHAPLLRALLIRQWPGPSKIWPCSTRCRFGSRHDLRKRKKCKPVRSYRNLRPRSTLLRDKPGAVGRARIAAFAESPSRREKAATVYPIATATTLPAVPRGGADRLLARSDAQINAAGGCWLRSRRTELGHTCTQPSHSEASLSLELAAILIV